MNNIPKYLPALLQILLTFIAMVLGCSVQTMIFLSSLLICTTILLVTDN